MSGTVVTFYSYKGGVGRSFTVANVGVILAQWGYKVLVVDWDIEAPGLNHYFAPFLGQTSPGVLGFVRDCQKGAPHSWATYCQSVKVPDCNDKLYLMPATGDRDADYSAAVQSLDWDALYQKHGFGRHLESLRTEWITHFDFVIVDSRTGVTDFSGITTAQLPDVLAFMFTANNQSFEGCCRIVRSAMATRRNLPIDRPAILPLPIIARFEQREEYDRAQEWRTKFSKGLNEFFEVWTPRSIEGGRLVDLLTIPYVPRWTFGEELAATIEPRDQTGVRTTGSPITYPLETVAAILANGFDKIELLGSSRDEYVLTARVNAPATAQEKLGPKVFISYSSKDREIADEVLRVLTGAGLHTFSQRDVRAGSIWSQQVVQQIEQASAFVAICSKDSLRSDWMRNEAEMFMRNNLRSQSPKPIIPLVLPDASTDFRKSILSSNQYTTIDPQRSLEDQLTPLLNRLAPASGDGAPKLFISYRRTDSGYVGRIFDRLQVEFGSDAVIMDIENIEFGVHLEEIIRDRIAKCDVMLAVIGPEWLDAHDRDGRRRLDDPSDIVRIEVAEALKSRVPIIPILVENTRIPLPGQLPEEIKELALRNALLVGHSSFDADMAKLMSAIRANLIEGAKEAKTK
jgi:cellulose biosynthesis protein BcsQ